MKNMRIFNRTNSRIEKSELQKSKESERSFNRTNSRIEKSQKNKQNHICPLFNRTNSRIENFINNKKYNYDNSLIARIVELKTMSEFSISGSFPKL